MKKQKNNQLIVIEINKPTKEQSEKKIEEINKVINILYGGIKNEKK